MPRPYLNGASPGKGVKAEKRTVTLPSEMVVYLRKLGGGNLSRGVRIAAERSKAGLTDQHLSKDHTAT